MGAALARPPTTTTTTHVATLRGVASNPTTAAALAVAAVGVTLASVAVGRRTMSLLSRGAGSSSSSSSSKQNNAPDAWLEEVTSSKALGWVTKQNERSTREIGDPKTDARFARIKAILDSKDKIPYAAKRGRFLYNFWKDEANPKGLWRRLTSIDEMKRPDATWDTVLDLDALDAAEGKPGWVWKGYTPLDEEPKTPEMRRCLVKLSRGGADAVEIREFDLERRAFVDPNGPDQGFHIKEAKTQVSYKSPNVLLVGTDTGPGSLTNSGYPRTVREWKRGTPLAAAPVVFEGQATDVSVSSWFEADNRGHAYEWRVRNPTFYTSERWVRIGHSSTSDFVKVPVPDDAEVSAVGSELLIQLRTDWTVPHMNARTFKSGSLLSVPLVEFCLSNGSKGEVVVLFEPTPTRSLRYFDAGKSVLAVATLDDVRSSVSRFRFEYDKRWVRMSDLPGPSEGGPLQQVDVWSFEEHRGDVFWMTAAGYTNPTSLLMVDASLERPSPTEHFTLVRRLPVMFDASHLDVSQHFCKSLDGTSVPYWMVRDRRHADKPGPTLLYGYGGFEVSLLPSYSAVVGVGWLERGFTYVVANIRGGGEYGPAWHQAALKEKRHKAYEDFEAVARDLHAKGVCSPAQLGIMGGSNGGLLVGNALVRAPELYGAVVCEVPLLDMKRYSHLLAGASWVAEYGDPDVPEEWAALQTISPYHLVRSARDKSYPATLFTTSTRDDRVHPAHARKMVHKMLELGHTNVLYYENIEGGHAGAADNAQTAFMELLAYRFVEQATSSSASGRSAGSKM